MKTVLMALSGFFALITTGRGQSPSLGSGLYRSVEDFRNNHRFHDLLDAQIQNGDLTAYDATHHMTNSAGCSGRARPPLFRAEGTLPTAHMKRYPGTPKLWYSVESAWWVLVAISSRCTCPYCRKMLDWRDDGGEFLLASDFKWLLAGLTLPGVVALLLYRIEK